MTLDEQIADAQELLLRIAKLDKILDTCGMALVLSDSTHPEFIKLDRELWQKAMDELDERDS